MNDNQDIINETCTYDVDVRTLNREPTSGVKVLISATAYEKGCSWWPESASGPIGYLGLSLDAPYIGHRYHLDRHLFETA